MRKPQKLQITLRLAKDGYRWHIRRGGNIIAESGEAYVRKAACRRTLLNMIDAILAGMFEFTAVVPAKKK